MNGYYLRYVYTSDFYLKLCYRVNGKKSRRFLLTGGSTNSPKVKLYFSNLHEALLLFKEMIENNKERLYDAEVKNFEIFD